MGLGKFLNHQEGERVKNINMADFVPVVTVGLCVVHSVLKQRG